MTPAERNEAHRQSKHCWQEVGFTEAAPGWRIWEIDDETRALSYVPIVGWVTSRRCRDEHLASPATRTLPAFVEDGERIEFYGDPFHISGPGELGPFEKHAELGTGQSYIKLPDFAVGVLTWLIEAMGEEPDVIPA